MSIGTSQIHNNISSIAVKHSVLPEAETVPLYLTVFNVSSINLPSRLPNPENMFRKYVSVRQSDQDQAGNAHMLSSKAEKLVAVTKVLIHEQFLQVTCHLFECKLWGIQKH